MPRLEFSDLAVITGLQTGIGPNDTSITIKDESGWPDGTIGPFIATLGDKEAGDSIEKILVTTRSGKTLQNCTRGYGGVGQTWGANTQIRHTIAGRFMAELSAHIFDTTRHDHTQYLRSSDHAAILHDAAMLGVDSVGNSELADDAVATANIQNLAVTDGKIAGVNGSKLVDASVALAKLAADARFLYVQTGDPGAVGNGRLWVDTNATRSVKIRNATDSGWDVLIDAPETLWVSSFVPTLFGVTLGTGGLAYCEYKKLGRTVTLHAGFKLGTGGDVTALIGIGLPFTANFQNPNAQKTFGCWLQKDTGPARYAGAGIITSSQPDRVSRAVNAGTTVGFDGSNPFNWDDGDEFWVTGVYEATS